MGGAEKDKKVYKKAPVHFLRRKKMKTAGVMAVIALGVFVAGCGKTVSRIDVDKQIDLSGRWNDTDSRLVSEEMISDCLSRPWLSRFSEEAGHAPTVIVGTVRNNTDEHIISETFTKDLERAFINSGLVRVVASRHEREEVREERREMQEWASDDTVKELTEEHAADFMLIGTVNSIRDREGRREVIFYQVNLELVHTQTNQKAWIGDKRIKKYIRN